MKLSNHLFSKVTNYFYEEKKYYKFELLITKNIQSSAKNAPIWKKITLYIISLAVATIEAPFILPYRLTINNHSIAKAERKISKKRVIIASIVGVLAVSGIALSLYKIMHHSIPSQKTDAFSPSPKKPPVVLNNNLNSSTQFNFNQNFHSFQNLNTSTNEYLPCPQKVTLQNQIQTHRDNISTSYFEIMNKNG